MKRTLIALSCLVLFASSAYGQGGILNDNVLRADGRPAIGATVRVCTEAASGTPCSPTASIFSDKALTVSKTNPIAVDSAAAYTYYAPPGFYKEQLCLGATCVTRTVQVADDVTNVTSFGATGDGTTDDTSAIQAAIGDTAGATVFLPCGTYRAEEIVLRNGVSLRGAGACSIIKGTDGMLSTESVVVVGGDSTCIDCAIFDLVIDANQDVTGHSNTQNHTVDIRNGTTNFLIFHTKLTDTGGDGIRIAPDGTASPIPTGIHLIDNDFSNHERQDIAVVGGTKITIVGNTGDGTLDIEPPTTPISDVTVSGGNQFNQLAVSNANNITVKADFNLTGGIYGNVTIFGVRGVTFTGNTVTTGTLLIGSADDIGIFGNNLRALDIWPPGAATRIKATGNIISHVTESAVTPPLTGQGTLNYAVAMRACTDCIVENNEIRTELGGFITSGDNPNSEFKQNKLIYAGGSPEAIAINMSATATVNDFVIDGNYADGFDQMLKIDGAQFCDNCKVTRNTAINSTLTTASWDFEFNRLSNGLVAWNQIHGDHNGVLLNGASASARIVFNYFHNTTASNISVQLTNSTASLGWNIDKTLRTTTLVLSGTPTATFEDRADPIRSFSSTDTTPGVLNGRVFKTANGSGTTITDFDDGTDGMRIWLIVDDANTTISDNANLNLRGGANKLYASGDVLQFVLNGTVWNEVPLHLTPLENPLEGTLTNIPRWIFKQVDFGDMTAGATADTFTLWTLPANTLIENVMGEVVTGWSGGSISAAVCSVGTNAGSANDLALDDNFFAAGTRYELHDATVNGGKGTLLFDATDKFAPYMFVAGGVIEIQCDLTGDNHANATAGQARIQIFVSQPLGNTTTEAN